MRTVNNICVAFNGPPAIGKDTLANWITNNSQIVCITIAEVVRSLAAEYYEDQNFVDNWERDWKDAYNEKYGCTPREALIKYSENQFPEDCMAKYGMTLQQYIASRAAHYKNSLITDLGYEREIQPIANKVDLLVIVRLRHPDFAFACGDTRQYLDYKADNVQIIDFTVTRGRAEFDSYDIRDEVQRVCEDYFSR